MRLYLCLCVCLSRILQGAFAQIILDNVAGCDDCKLTGSLSTARQLMPWADQAPCKRSQPSKLESASLQICSTLTTLVLSPGGGHSGLPGKPRRLIHHWANSRHRRRQECHVSSIGGDLRRSSGDL